MFLSTVPPEDDPVIRVETSNRKQNTAVLMVSYLFPFVINTLGCRTGLEEDVQNSGHFMIFTYATM
jgi:hypothetical protein